MKITHHIDGDKHNNDASNLMVLDSHRDHMEIHRSCKTDYDKLIARLTPRNIESSEEALSKCLDVLFTKAQKYIVLRKLYGYQLNKTEKEVFSRSIRSTLLAVAHYDLHRLAQMVVWKSL